MKAIKVNKRKAHEILKRLKKENLLDDRYNVKKTKPFLYFPVKSNVKGYKILNVKFERKVRQRLSLVEALQRKLPKSKLELVPRSYDIIGDIAVIEIKPGLTKYEKLIANTLLDLNKNVKVVAKKVGIHKGLFRTQDLKVLAGEKRKTTLHKENNVKIFLNVETCYFSPRLSTERKRVMEQVKKNETVLIMFSGVAPYPLVIAKNTGVKEVIGIEINSEAHKFAEQNLVLNKIKNIKLYCGNVKKIVPKLKKKFDRIAMPLPKDAEHFLGSAKLVSKKGTIIHFYDFLDEKEFPEKSISKIRKVFKNFKVLKAVKCGQYSPGRYRVCIDFKVL